ncbi:MULTISPECIES: hypothetical protein [Pseudonocardia]|uniref:DUF3618 domain-containing protein n=2 Tax=Pseudonocardia TaxID=1847 RepID=A0A1Y2MU33_PSEAH|nr:MULTISPECIES: hypothetical protein [Pseudonocardia]OSY38705.1 hypothetical protein BG845_03907 [Pseudonocardia autotrophica]TDN74907.1 hypothetical protein C8E95_4042 [Pseudonocardia autotrophica]BBF98846.1 hypothetical protein Pdca_00560 [Pseudonocardia autotrophica]GEC26564.1 hypothetical protein PSA01_35930 [Pseudonocardia saturnea]
MRADRKRARARKDAAEAVHTLADAGRIAGGAAVSTASARVSELGHGVEDARRALAAAIDPAPARTRRTPWILAVVLLSGLAAFAWVTLLRRERPVDPGTPVPTVPPADSQIHGKPIGQGGGAA